MKTKDAFTIVLIAASLWAIIIASLTKVIGYVCGF